MINSQIPLVDQSGRLTIPGIQMLQSLRGGSVGSVAWADVTGKPATFTPSSHTHAIADVTGLQSALDAKQDVVSPLLGWFV